LRILLTNDDGIHADGLAALERIAAKLSDDVWVVAPEYEQSGASRALTLADPIRVRQLSERRFATTGTPTDCVMLGVNDLIPGAKPDLVLSGVNRGANLAEEVTYSGTVSAAMEGALAGVRSIALSQAYSRQGLGDNVPFAAAEAFGARIVRALIDQPFTPRTLVNVNFPAAAPDAINGNRVCRQGFHDYGRLRIVERVDPRGYPYFWFGLAPTASTPGHVTDLEAIADGFIAVTPLHLDLTDERFLPELAANFAVID
jgi:5'-nucleotidase